MAVRAIMVCGLAVQLFCTATAALPQAQPFPAPLPEEEVGTVAKLPSTYGSDYLFVTDLHFSSLLDGRAALVDVADPSRGLKGQVRIAQFGNLLVSKLSDELYTTETFFSRLTGGERTDVLTIWDKATLAPKGEVILPGAKRGHFVTQPNALQFTNSEKWALVYNFSPAASVTVVDLPGRRVLGEISIPGCALIYPTGERGFSTLCGDGSWTFIELTESATVKGTQTSEPLMDIDSDPWFMIPAVHESTGWFVSYRGRVRGFDFSGGVPRETANFSLTSDPQAPEGYRPGGWQVAAVDPTGLLYVLMNPNGKEGSHKDGGSEVWVVDGASHSTIRKIPLKRMVLSIEVTRGSKPLIVGAAHGGSLDVYAASSGTFLHTIGQAVNDPFTMIAAGR